MVTHSKASTESHKKIYLSETDKKLAGVCGGIADYLNVDSSVIRLLWVVLTIFSGVVPGILAYIGAALIMERRPSDVASVNSAESE